MQQTNAQYRYERLDTAQLEAIQAAATAVLEGDGRAVDVSRATGNNFRSYCNALEDHGDSNTTNSR